MLRFLGGNWQEKSLGASIIHYDAKFFADIIPDIFFIHGAFISLC